MLKSDRMRGVSRSVLLLLGVAILAGGVLAVGSGTAFGGKGKDKRIVKIKTKKKVLGKRCSDWTIEWWQWSQSIPRAANPMLDETGEDIMVGQRGEVWFLGGIFNESGIVERTATIPTGKYLFFPIINVESDNIGQDPPRDVETLKNEAATLIDLVDTESLYVTINGVGVEGLEKFRITAGPYKYWYPADNIGLAIGFETEEGIYAPAMSDGYWAMLKPLPEGKHTVKFGGTVGPPINFVLDITYHLTVVESDGP